MLDLFKRRKKNVYKDDFGHVLVLAGAPTMLGAAALTGLAAMRSGAGLTTLAVAKSLNLAIQKKISNVIMTLPLPQTRQGTIALKAFDVLKLCWSKYSVVAIGPGMSTAPSTVAFVKEMYLKCPLPMVIDADALNALALIGGLSKKPFALRVLTPHPGEMSRLTGLSKEHIQKNRKTIALEYAKRWGCVLVLKGHGTVVASPEGKVFINKTGGPELATAGSGDVLTGIVAAFLARGIGFPFKAVCQAVFFHGSCGDLISVSRLPVDIIASDIIDGMPL